MTIGIHIRRLGVALAAFATASTVIVPAAVADPPQGHRPAAQPDLIERWVDGRAGTGEPDLIERYVASHALAFVGRDQPDGYQPGLRTTSPSGGASTSDGFAWDDAGLGALGGFAFALLAGGALVSLRTRGRVAHS